MYFVRIKKKNFNRSILRTYLKNLLPTTFPNKDMSIYLQSFKHINFGFSMEKSLGDKNESLGDKNESLGDKHGNSHPLFYGSFMWE